MKHAEIQEFSKEKKKEHRMRIDKIKEIARQYKQDRHDQRVNKVLLEKYRYDERYLAE